MKTIKLITDATMVVTSFIYNTQFQSHPVTDVFIELQSKELQYYSMTLHITAHFSGLRYIMFHWPILSAAIGKSNLIIFSSKMKNEARASAIIW